MTKTRTVPCLALIAALASALGATASAAFTARLAPTFPRCLADAPPPPFAGHALPLATPPDPQPMTLVRAFPSLPPFARPVLALAPPDGSKRLFVVERAGVIRSFRADRNASASRVFLDLRALVESAGADEGLLGLAFDPDFAANGLFYVHYTAPASQCDGTRTCSRVARYALGADPDAADPQTGVLLLEVTQPDRTHNGGPLAFGPDRMLYVALGDGGGSGDPSGNAQNLGSLLGKILRIDPHGAFPYAIPPDNPFVGNLFGGRPEVWAYGLRQPSALHFDAPTRALWLSDQGQAAWEEIDVLDRGGVNLGWNACEGSHDFGGRRCRDLVSQPPRIEMPHAPSGGYAVIGGLVYRGDRLPSLFGAYLYTDFATGHVFAFDGARSVRVAGMNQISGFAEGPDGELLIVRNSDGRLHRFAEAAFAAGSGLPARLSETGLFADVTALVPAPGLVPYAVNVGQAADGARIQRWLALPAGARVSGDAGGGLRFPEGSVLLQHLELPDGSGVRRLETRILLRQSARWLAASYRWNAAQTDADLVTQGGDLVLTLAGSAGPVTRSWHVPGPTECTDCHARSVGTLLGARPPQLQLAWRCAQGTESQLAAWSALGLLDPAFVPPTGAETLVDPADPSARLGRRARALLDVQCASCHQPAGRAPGNMDLRRTTAWGDLRVAGAPVENGALGLTSPVLLAPGAKERSMLWHRVQTPIRVDRMPPGSVQNDPLATALLGAWIDADPSRDDDADGVIDDADVCPDAFDPGQADADQDGVGDACDAACANGLDDDGDGAIDFDRDPGCQNAEPWASESPQCSNRVDDDGDGATDWPADATCLGPWQESEGRPFARIGCGLLGIEGACGAWALPAAVRALAARRRRARAGARGAAA